MLAIWLDFKKSRGRDHTLMNIRYCHPGFIDWLDTWVSSTWHLSGSPFDNFASKTPGASHTILEGLWTYSYTMATCLEQDLVIALPLYAHYHLQLFEEQICSMCIHVLHQDSSTAFLIISRTPTAWIGPVWILLSFLKWHHCPTLCVSLSQRFSLKREELDMKFFVFAGICCLF